MDGSKDSLRKRQTLRSEHVEHGNTDYGCKDQESALPVLGHVIGVVQDDYALDNHAHDVRVDRNNTLPRDSREPASRVVSIARTSWVGHINSPDI